MLIISAIEKQFSRLYEIKIGMMQGKKTDNFAFELKLPPFVCEKLMGQSRRFNTKKANK